MKRMIIRFGCPIDSTPTGLDATVIRFPFSMIDFNLLGAPEEQQNTSHHAIEVAISRTTQRCWDVDKPALDKVLFELAKRHLAEKLREGASFAEKEQFDITTKTHGNFCPFDPERIEEPDGAELIVEIRPKIGFR